jgi:hypothetical protein
MLNKWVQRNPEMVIPQLGSSLIYPAARPIVLWAFTYDINPRSVIPWLTPLIENWNDLSEDELFCLIDAFWQTSHPDAGLPLKRLQTLLPAEKMELHREIDLALTHCEKIGVEPGDISTLKD